MRAVISKENRFPGGGEVLEMTHWVRKETQNFGLSCLFLISVSYVKYIAHKAYVKKIFTCSGCAFTNVSQFLL